MHTFIFANIFQSKSQSRVFPFHDPDFAESALAYHAQESKVVEVDYNKSKEEEGSERSANLFFARMDHDR